MESNNTNNFLGEFLQAIYDSAYESDQFLVFECESVPADIEIFTKWCRERLLDYEFVSAYPICFLPTAPA